MSLHFSGKDEWDESFALCTESATASRRNLLDFDQLVGDCGGREAREYEILSWQTFFLLKTCSQFSMLFIAVEKRKRTVDYTDTLKDRCALDMGSGEEGEGKCHNILTIFERKQDDTMSNFFQMMKSL